MAEQELSICEPSFTGLLGETMPSQNDFEAGVMWKKTALRRAAELGIDSTFIEDSEVVQKTGEING